MQLLFSLTGIAEMRWRLLLDLIVDVVDESVVLEVLYGVVQVRVSSIGLPCLAGGTAGARHVVVLRCCGSWGGLGLWQCCTGRCSGNVAWGVLV